MTCVNIVTLDIYNFFFFFFQAEDGIRDIGVTGVQTCALPIYLHADAAEGGPGLVDAVVDVRPEGVQRHAALAVELRPAHLGAAQATGALHPDALDLRAALGRLHGLAHGATEADPAGELLGDEIGRASC